MAKKQILCPVCNGHGFTIQDNSTEGTISASGKWCVHCGGTGLREVTVTNADRIRAMSDEELAEFLEGDYGNMEVGFALSWLKKPAEEVHHE